MALSVVEEIILLPLWNLFACASVDILAELGDCLW